MSLSERRRYEFAPQIGRPYTFQVPFFGFLEAVEVRFAEPLPNMDAGRTPYRVHVQIYGPEGEIVPSQMLCHFREVESGA